MKPVETKYATIDRDELRALTEKAAKWDAVQGGEREAPEVVGVLHTHTDGRQRVQFPGRLYDQDAGWGASIEPLITLAQYRVHMAAVEKELSDCDFQRRVAIQNAADALAAKDAEIARLKEWAESEAESFDQQRRALDRTKAERDELRAQLAADKARITSLEDYLPVVWRDGPPPHPWDQEWFIGLLDNDGRVVLKALPEERSYDFRTADETYYSASRIKMWAQFPDSEYVSAPAPQLAQQGAGVPVHVVFDGPPGPEAGRFVECETPDGKSINAGEWRERKDGLWELIITPPARSLDRVVLPEQLEIERPRSQPNSWDDHAMGWNACLDRLLELNPGLRDANNS